MEFTIDARALLAGVMKVYPTLNQEVTIDALKGFKFELGKGDVRGLIISGTDLTYSVKHGIKEGTGGLKILDTEPVPFVVGATVIKNMLEVLDGELHITRGSNTLSIKTQGSKFNLMIAQADIYPQLPIPSGKDFLEVDRKAFEAVMRRIVPFRSLDSTRYTMEGIYFEDNKAMSSDGHRMAIEKIGWAFPHCLLPAEILQKFLAGMDSKSEAPLRVINEKNAVFIIDGTTVYTIKKIEGEFPDILQVLPTRNEGNFRIKYQCSASFKKDVFLNALSKLRITNYQKCRRVAVKFTPFGATLSCENPEIGQSVVEVAGQTKGEVTFGINVDYLMQAIKVFDGENITLEAASRLDPIVIREGDYQHVIMPLRI